MEAKVKDPIVILTNGKKVMVKLRGEKYEVNRSMNFGGAHFGFMVRSYKDGQVTESVFPTNCEVSEIQVMGTHIAVFELHKTNPWLFYRDGEFLRCGKFSMFSCIDLEHVGRNVKSCDIRQEIKQTNRNLERGLSK